MTDVARCETYRVCPRVTTPVSPARGKITSHVVCYYTLGMNPRSRHSCGPLCYSLAVCTCHFPLFLQVVSKIFTRLRGVGTYRSLFGSYKVTAVRDLAEGHGFDSEKVDNKPSLPLVGGGAHFLTFTFGDDAVVATLRTSGTEPKIK